MPVTPQDFQPIHARQRKIENDKVVLLREQHVVSLITTIQMFDNIARLTQGACKPFSEIGVVFNEEYAHG